MKSNIDEALETNHNRFDDDGDQPRPEDNKNVRNLPVIKELPEVVAVDNVEEPETEQHVKDDYTLARDMQRKLLLQQQELITTMQSFVNAAPSPRAFEVMNNMMKTAAELAERLLEVHKQLKDINDESPKGGGSGQSDTYMFVGGPTEILKQMADAVQKETKIIDVTPNEPIS